MGSYPMINEGQLTDTYADSTVKRPSYGEVRYDPTTGKHYRFVKLIDAVDGTANKFAVIADATEWYATIDYAGGSAIGGDGKHIGAGMLLGAVDISAAPGCWLQITGRATFTAGSAGIIAGDYLIPDDSEDGDLEESAGTAGDVYAQALATVADDATGACMLRNML